MTKYGAIRTPCRHGHVHSSAKESRRCNDLHLLERAGEITHLEVQPVYRFVVDGRPVKTARGSQLKFTPDFRFRERSGQLVCEDVKGLITEAYKVRAAFFRAFHPDTELRET